MTERRKEVKLITPRGLAIFPAITKPDAKFPKNGYPVYHCKLLLEPSDELTAFLEKAQKRLDEEVEAVRAELKAKKEGAKVKTLKVAAITKPQADKETGDETGKLIINAKLTSGGKNREGEEFSQKPTVYDSRGTELSKPPLIYGGSTLKLGVNVFGYYNAKDNEVGVSFRLKAAQIIKLAERKQSYDFGKEDDDGDGYVADDGAPAGDFNDESENPAPTKSAKSGTPDF